MTAPIVIDERGYTPLPGKLGEEGWMAFLHAGVRVTCAAVPQSRMAIIMLVGGDLDDPAFEPDVVAAVIPADRLDQLITELTALRADLAALGGPACPTGM